MARLRGLWEATGARLSPLRVYMWFQTLYWSLQDSDEVEEEVVEAPVEEVGEPKDERWSEVENYQLREHLRATADTLGPDTLGSSSIGMPKDHIAFSNIPGVGRPLVKNDDGSFTLSGSWECTGAERKRREAWAESGRLLRLLNTTMYPHHYRHETNPDAAFLAAVEEKRKAAADLKKLLKNKPPLV